MAKTHRAATVFGLVALVMALLAFMLGSAPFTPALVLTVPAVAVAVVSGLYGAWRFAVVAIYFSCAAWLPVLMARSFNVRLDYMLLALGILGLGVAGVLFHGHVRSVRAS